MPQCAGDHSYDVALQLEDEDEQATIDTATKHATYIPISDESCPLHGVVGPLLDVVQVIPSNSARTQQPETI